MGSRALGLPLPYFSLLLCYVSFLGVPYSTRALSRDCALRPVRVRIKSRSTSASPPTTAIIKRPVLAAVSAHGSAGPELRLRIHDLLDDGKQVEGAAGQKISRRVMVWTPPDGIYVPG